ncbi:hypothetical protein DCAR_0205471 [Daucus carota subsp. sativus]|uniref:Uncharacterized protein n=1 Tax=Daucus carota subsp. sativus TaxID=79200 RepID=A0A166CMS3_DAUCS|nr:PREDICTED: uncharacterized protein LOC108208442 [Daucus carota subsp. sativus]WOG86270.1 hypothetical protein DCAR_0205471 [Daucus carota subsp. sativus]
MSKLVFVLLVFLVSLHACNSRGLSLSADRKTDSIFHTIGKDVHSRKLRSLFINSEPTVVQTEEHISTSTTGTDEFEDEVMGKDSAADSLKKEGKKGGKVALSYLEETAQIEKWRQARSTLESSPNEVKETAKSEDDETMDDVVSMDYAKPHRKPPIHNKKL